VQRNAHKHPCCNISPVQLKRDHANQLRWNSGAGRRQTADGRCNLRNHWAKTLYSATVGAQPRNSSIRMVFISVVVPPCTGWCITENAHVLDSYVHVQYSYVTGNPQHCHKRQTHASTFSAHNPLTLSTCADGAQQTFQDGKCPSWCNVSGCSNGNRQQHALFKSNPNRTTKGGRPTLLFSQASNRMHACVVLLNTSEPVSPQVVGSCCPSHLSTYSQLHSSDQY
jgi:hypothetical protein